jgi:hypothetical protein
MLVFMAWEISTVIFVVCDAVYILMSYDVPPILVDTVDR